MPGVSGSIKVFIFWVAIVVVQIRVHGSGDGESSRILEIILKELSTDFGDALA